MSSRKKPKGAKRGAVVKKSANAKKSAGFQLPKMPKGLPGRPKLPEFASTPLAKEVFGIGIFVFSAFLLLCLVSYSVNDSDWYYEGERLPTENWGGLIGAHLAHALMLSLGHSSLILPFVIAFLGACYYRHVKSTPDEKDLTAPLRMVGFFMLTLSSAAICHLHIDLTPNTLPEDTGGIIGGFVGYNVHSLLGLTMATLLLLAAFVGGLTLLTRLPWLEVFGHVGYWTLQGVNWLKVKFGGVAAELEERKAGKEAREERHATVSEKRKKMESREEPRIEPKVKPRASKRAAKEKQEEMFEPASGQLPPIDLLELPPKGQVKYSKDTLNAMAQQVEMKLADFGVEVEVVSVHSGPVITRFELKPAPGVKVAQIVSLAKDLARALSTVSVRVVEIIPGKPYVGLEIPNQDREIVTLREIIDSEQYESLKAPLPMSLGKDIGGAPVVTDLAKMPHVLVAGTTGSGKSVAINVMLISLLYRCTPQDVRLLMIDPKMLELSVYEGIPHLLAPVVTDMSEAANGLRWCVGEMERRYKLMSAVGVRNLAGYNRKVRDAEKQGTPLKDPTYQPADLAILAEEDFAIPELQPLPHIVVTIDELADLMMVAGKKVEELIVRLAQKARAAGIHLILATQRPSVDVITGLIKSNVPTRIAFQVASKIDSRTILDQMGAESLLGQGDMLYLPPGKPLPVRVHGAFVDDDEVHDIVEFIKSQGEPQYIEGVLEGPNSADGPIPGVTPDKDDTEADPLYDEAVQIVMESRKASISYIQRRLRIGYNRAARLVEHMEQVGLVGPLGSNGSRKILVPGGDE